jgi:hypothetical protein
MVIYILKRERENSPFSLYVDEGQIGHFGALQQLVVE